MINIISRGNDRCTQPIIICSISRGDRITVLLAFVGLLSRVAVISIVGGSFNSSPIWFVLFLAPSSTYQTKSTCGPDRVLPIPGSSGATSGHHWPPLATTGHHWPPLATTGNHWQPLATIGHHWPPQATAGHHWPPLATAGQWPWAMGQWPMASGQWPLAIRACE